MAKQGYFQPKNQTFQLPIDAPERTTKEWPASWKADRGEAKRLAQSPEKPRAKSKGKGGAQGAAENQEDQPKQSPYLRFVAERLAERLAGRMPARPSRRTPVRPGGEGSNTKNACAPRTHQVIVCGVLVFCVGRRGLAFLFRILDSRFLILGA